MKTLPDDHVIQYRPGLKHRRFLKCSTDPKTGGLVWFASGDIVTVECNGAGGGPKGSRQEIKKGRLA
jgi:hypothetical protein